MSHSSRDSERGAGAVLALALAVLVAPAMASAAAPYVVERSAIEDFKPLPLDEEIPVVTPVLESRFPNGNVGEDSVYGSAGIVLPFPVRFFGEVYEEVGAGVGGILTFGPRSQTLCVREQRATNSACANRDGLQAGPIPRDGIFPNRLLAIWWENIACTGIKHQTLGSGSTRSFVIEYRCGGSTTPFDAQVWFREGDSSIEVRYGPGDLGTSERRAQVGLMSPPAGGGPTEGYPGLPCSNPGFSCWGQDYPASSSLLYTVPPDLSVGAVTVEGAAGPGLEMRFKAVISNLGDAVAVGASTRFYLSKGRTLGLETVELGDIAETFDLPVRESIEVELLARLPENLTSGSYYVLAHADPFGAVASDTNLDNNLGASAAIQVGVNSPLLLAEAIEVPRAAAAGQPLSISWTVRNDGSGRAQQVPYAIFLSEDRQISGMDRLLHEGELTVPAFATTNESLQIDLPSDLLAGTYYAGLVLDPTHVLPTTFKQRAIEVSEPVEIEGAALRILTTSLPVAELGSSWCLGLDAEGGSGSHEWAVEEGSQLPPGLALQEIPAGAKLAGLPFVTRLCGKPNAPGLFAFSLRVNSGGSSQSESFELEVRSPGQPLQFVTTELPLATYFSSYEARLRALGGTSPYFWDLSAGRLPVGITLQEDGRIAGAAVEDGRYVFSVRLTDAAGVVLERSITLLVTSPTFLTCGTRSLPTLELGVEFSGWLSAAGGIRPHRWQTIETRRLSGEVDESAESLESIPPPGLSLSNLGEVSGAPSEAGLYLWTVAVSDAAAMPAEDLCIIVVDVPLDHGLTISTGSLGNAVVGESYSVQLTAAGGAGALEWKLMAGDFLPAGISLSSSGLLEGIPSGEQLDEEPERSFPFLVEVRDSQNRRGRASLSITVLARTFEQPPVRSESSEGGCASAGASGFGGIAVGLAALIVGRRRRAG